MADVVLAVVAHPDDAEFLCAGTLLRLVREKGWHGHIATMTPGDCGSAELPAEAISRLRRAEGHNAAGLLPGAYYCLEERDLRVFYSEQALEKVTRLLRQVRPRIVITHSPSDYMVDHEVTSTLTRTACFAAPVPNFLADHPLTQPSPPGGRGQGEGAGRPLGKPLEGIPHLYYCDAIEGKDIHGADIPPDFCIDISHVLETKAEMLAAHASQREWLLRHHGMDHYVQSMKGWSAHRGKQVGVAFAEGFRQHLGHSYPQDNLLGAVLGVAGNQG